MPLAERHKSPPLAVALAAMREAGSLNVCNELEADMAAAVSANVRFCRKTVIRLRLDPAVS
ncbi:hypothetical protein HNP47_001705 [Brevundimonas vesicularis]|uniref:Uncharacterized protein n=1 Tax=Brevundimonas vesicularis TaxID=41276 RepID=A0A7W9L5T8_BREVE|nr:hypothetical protein [Brevundimonas vesicularis]